MKKSKKRKSRYVKIYYKEPSKNCPKGMFWVAKMTDATKSVTINSTLEHAMSGARGVTIGCHLSNCGLANADAFPHPALLVSFTQSRADVITKFVTGKKHNCEAVRYKHPYGQWVDLNDKDEHKEWIRANPDKAVRPFTLSPTIPKKRQIKQNTGAKNEGSRRSFVPKGALRRAIAAGLIGKAVGDMLEHV